MKMCVFVNKNLICYDISRCFSIERRLRNGSESSSYHHNGKWRCDEG